MPEIIVQVLVDPLLVGQDDAAETAALTVDMLGGGIDDDMRAELERLLLQRRRKDIVDDKARADRIGELGHEGDVDHLERRIGRALQEEQLGVRPHRLFPFLRLGAVDQRRLDTVFRHQRLDHPAARAEQRARRHDVIAGPCRAQQRCRDRRHAGRRGARILGAFQRAHALLEHVDGRVGVARIDEARLFALEARFGRFRAFVDVALRQEHRLRRLAETRSQGAGMHQGGLGSQFAFAGTGHDGCLKNKKTGRESRVPVHERGLGPINGPLATCLTWLQADRPNHHGINVL